jgi:hypothetical protein
MKSRLNIKLLLLLSFALTLYVNYLSNALPINGFTAGQLSDIYPNLFVPAGLTFAIWGVIYLACIFSVLFLLIDKSRDIGTASRYFILVNGLNASWLFAWHYQQLIISLLIMLTLLYTLTKWYIYIRTNYGSSVLKMSLEITSSLYLSWISVATIANFTTVLVHYELYPKGQVLESIAASLVLVIALVICYFVVKSYSDFVHPLVLAWASYGIYIKRTNDGNVDDGFITYTSIAVLVAALIISALMAKRSFTKSI